MKFFGAIIKEKQKKHFFSSLLHISRRYRRCLSDVLYRFREYTQGITLVASTFSVVSFLCVLDAVSKK